MENGEELNISLQTEDELQRGWCQVKKDYSEQGLKHSCFQRVQEQTTPQEGGGDGGEIRMKQRILEEAEEKNVKHLSEKNLSKQKNKLQTKFMDSNRNETGCRARCTQ